MRGHVVIASPRTMRPPCYAALYSRVMRRGGKCRVSKTGRCIFRRASALFQSRAREQLFAAMADEEARVHLRLDGFGQTALDSYLEYRAIVGDDEVLMSPAEYEAYKAKVLPIRRANRLYVTWGPVGGNIDCKVVGPETMCFCGHRYRQHLSDFEHVVHGADLLLHCKSKGCSCASYTFVPRVSGSMPVRCTACKHSPGEHNPSAPYLCKQRQCECAGFSSSYPCECGKLASSHFTRVETRAERSTRGMPVDNLAGGRADYAGIGGITHFSSLAGGHERAQIQQAEAVHHQHAVMAPVAAGKSRPMTEEEALAYYEQRYQARVRQSSMCAGYRRLFSPPQRRAEREAARGGKGKAPIAVSFANGIPLALQDLLSTPDAAAASARKRDPPAAAKPREAAAAAASSRLGAAPSKAERLDKANADMLGRSDLFDWTPASAARALPRFRQAPVQASATKGGVGPHKKTTARPEWRDDF